MNSTGPLKNKRLSIGEVFPDEGMVFFWADDRLVDILDEYGGIHRMNEEHHYRMVVDPRYNFRDVMGYLLAFENELPLPVDGPDPGKAAQSETPSVAEYTALSAKLARLRERLTAQHIDAYLTPIAEEAFTAVHGTYAETPFEDMSTRIQTSYELICRTAILSYLRRVWENLDTQEDPGGKDLPF